MRIVETTSSSRYVDWGREEAKLFTFKKFSTFICITQMVKNYADWSPRPSGIRPCLFRCSIRLSNSFMAKILPKLSSFSNNLSEKLFNFGKNHTGLCVHYHWDFKKKCFNPSQFMFWRYKSTFSDQTILQKNWLINFFRKKIL